MTMSQSRFAFLGLHKSGISTCLSSNLYEGVDVSVLVKEIENDDDCGLDIHHGEH